MTESFSTSRVPYLCLLFDNDKFVAEQTVKSEITAVASEGFKELKAIGSFIAVSAYIGI